MAQWLWMRYGISDRHDTLGPPRKLAVFLRDRPPTMGLRELEQSLNEDHA